MENENEVLKELMGRFGEQNKPKEGTMTFKTAIEKAYADMSRRAQNHRDSNRVSSINYLLEESSFVDVINGERTFTDQTDFDDWHRAMCTKLKEKMTGNNFSGRIGRAQKVINMAFKYLMYTETPCAGVRDYCHMTLDSYTLAWFKREVKRVKSAGIKFSDAFTWSKIDKYDDYIAIQEDIRNYLASDNNRKYSVDITGLNKTESVDLPPQPILAEFIIWEGEKLFEKYTDLVKGIQSYYKEGEEGGKEADSWLINDSFSTFLYSVIQ